MADEATAGNDQPKVDESQQKAGDDQQSNPNDERIAQLEEELKNTNAAFTRYQQEQAQAPEPAADDTEEFDTSGVTAEQRKLLLKVTGADEIRKELDQLKKDREAERQQRNADRLQSDVAQVAKEFSPDKGYPKVELQEIGDHMQKTGIFNPRAAYKDLHESAIYDVQRKADKPKASPGDRPDATQEPGLSKEEYQKKLLELSLDGKHEERRKLMIKHGAVVPEEI